MAIRNIHLIFKKYQHMIADIDVEPSGLDVWLKRPYLFSGSDASCTFMPFELFEDKKDPFKSCVWAVNQQLREEAVAIDPKDWDEGRGV
tara:strand:+ start:144 stop:410 length:267 start_codon:yes stop_codon:yes gene_type:complete